MDVLTLSTRDDTRSNVDHDRQCFILYQLVHVQILTLQPVEVLRECRWITIVALVSLGIWMKLSDDGLVGFESAISRRNMRVMAIESLQRWKDTPRH